MRDQTVTGNLWCYCWRIVEQEVERFWADQALQTDCIVCVHQRLTKYWVGVKLIKREATGADFLRKVSICHIFKQKARSYRNILVQFTSTPATLPNRCIFCIDHSFLPHVQTRQAVTDKWSVSYLPCSSSGLTDCCLRSGACLLWLASWPSKEMRFFTGGWLKVWARRRKCRPPSGSSSGKAGGEPGGEWPGDSSSCWGGQNGKGKKMSVHK